MGTKGCWTGASEQGWAALAVAVPGYKGGSRLAGSWPAQGDELPGRLPWRSTPAPAGADSALGRFCGRP